jgi:hypothetical protein
MRAAPVETVAPDDTGDPDGILPKGHATLLRLRESDAPGFTLDDLACSRCGGRMVLLATIEESVVGINRQS